MKEEISHRFSIGDTVAIGVDMEIENDETIIILKGTKAIIQHIADDFDMSKKGVPMRLFFGLKNVKLDFWSQYWLPVMTRKVLTEKTILCLQIKEEMELLDYLRSIT